TRHGNETIENRHLSRAGLDHVDKDAVDLDDVDAERGDIGQVRVAGAGVVHGQARAKRVKAGNDAVDRSRVFQRTTLSDLKDELIIADRRIAKDGLHIVDNTDVAEMALEEVDRDFQ